MPRPKPSLEDLEDRVSECVRTRPGGLPWTELMPAYRHSTGVCERTAKQNLRDVRVGVECGVLRLLGVYQGPKGLMFGAMDDKVFLGAMEDAQKPPPSHRPEATLQLGGLFQDSEVRSEWTRCPVTNRIVRTTVITMGLADFMECQICYRVHFLGVSPRMQNQRVYAWQVDPLVCAADYADELSSSRILDPRTGRTPRSAIRRVQEGGRYVGLRYRSSWDRHPKTGEDKGPPPWKGAKPTVPVRMVPSWHTEHPVDVRYLSPEVGERRARKPRRTRRGR
jgi:hypothetical protein